MEAEWLLADFPDTNSTLHGGYVQASFWARGSEAEGGLVLWVADLGEKEAMLQSEPEKFFTTPHYDGHPTVLVNVKSVTVQELRELITESWRLRAPKRVLQAYEETLR